VSRDDQGVLRGVKVVDFTHWMAGPHASLVLADFGADIIKIEPSPSGDPSRTGGGQGNIGTESQAFLSWNRNKRSVCIDLRSEAGIGVARELIASADVLMQNFRPGIAERMGIGYADCRSLNPRLIYCSISAFGSKGPLGDQPGIDPVIQAFSGLLSVTGEPDGAPVFAGMAVADYVGAMAAVQAVLLGLIARQRSGTGQHAEVSLLGATVAGMAARMENAVHTGFDPIRTGSQKRSVYPNQVFRTCDGYIVAGITADKGWPKFCDALGVPDLARDERYNSNALRLVAREELAETLGALFEQETTAVWERRFVDRGLLFTRVNTFTELARHPQAQAMSLIEYIDHPLAGTIPQVAAPISLSDTPSSLRCPPPLLGQHTREVLAENGFDATRIDELLAAGMIAENTARAESNRA
jgi:crotonobetainyl-CoA:carnitine CoA-transferase CaiB-like acyl-CoA transferase